MVRSKLGTDLLPIVNQYFRVNDPRDTVSNINKAKRLLNWYPVNKIEKIY